MAAQEIVGGHMIVDQHGAGLDQVDKQVRHRGALCRAAVQEEAVVRETGIQVEQQMGGVPAVSCVRLGQSEPGQGGAGK